ncbi:ABC transporter ATP-binding protein [Caenimonas aquaedulcis]|uniref:ABC transporter ATP-binding protein n=1 Tax=Caenimonas aquaedulcis TaxID=2793270 RepID=A0A931H3S6_9BURK|nr:ABC transporter ATP-binding protein [Caenimonas aquaedulcis]MBG9387987.1 ABC transporter ATP-binding protein [Caenimonas aquaedulcis]
MTSASMRTVQASTAPVLEIEGLSIELPAGADRSHAAKNLDIRIYPGQTTCIVGESGSGKSLAALATMRLLPEGVRMSGGAIRLNGQNLAALTEAQMRGVRGRDIGMIFQEPLTALNPVMRIGDQIREVLEVHGQGSRASRTAKAMELITEVGLPEPARIIRAFPHELSGGQRQRVVIAMALALEPRLLIADEPTTALDVTTQAQILKLIADLRERHHMAVMFITHDFGVVREIADRVIVMRHGERVEEGSAREVLGNPQHAYTRQLLDAVPTMVPPPARRLPEEEALVVSNLNKTYGQRQMFAAKRTVHAVSDVSFAIRRGETLGLVGESGSGKSTVGRCVIRLIEPDTGTIRVGDLQIDNLSLRELRPQRRRVQMVFQDPFGSLDQRRTVGASISEGMIANGASTAQARARSIELLELVGLQPAAVDRYPHEFSGGQRQRVGIARALALNPDVLIADEAVSALDVSVQYQVLQLLREVQARMGLAILFVTHDLRVAAQMCDRIAVMQKGKLVELQDTRDLLSSPRHAYTKALLASVPGHDMMPLREAARVVAEEAA